MVLKTLQRRNTVRAATDLQIPQKFNRRTQRCEVAIGNWSKTLGLSTIRSCTRSHVGYSNITKSPNSAFRVNKRATLSSTAPEKEHRQMLINKADLDFSSKIRTVNMAVYVSIKGHLIGVKE